MRLLISFAIFALFCLSYISGETCDELYGSEDSFVCICKDASCSTIGQVDPPSAGNYLQMSSSSDSLRFSLSENEIDVPTNTTISYTVLVSVNVSDQRQSIIGFGGAFTDSAGINIATMNPILQETLIQHYFGPEGIEYNVGRVPIAGTDFSTYPYSYDEVEGDIELVNFALTEEDYKYKIPYIKMARDASEKGLLLFASPWAPPYWMKTNGMVNGSGTLLPEMQQPWANYFIKFFEAYENESITFWGLTAQNEPSGGLLTDYRWNACGYTAESMLEFVRDYWGPTLNASKYSQLQRMVADDNRETFPWFPNTVLEDSTTDSYVDGVAIHWYADKEIPPSVIDNVHDEHPEKFFLYTEACHQYFSVLPGGGGAVKLGSWKYGEQYAFSIIENSNHWSGGWVDWNLVLDMNGGPNWAFNYVDSPVIVSEDGLEFYKQPMFYVLGHFSKFIPYGSISLGTTVDEIDTTPRQSSISSASYLTPSNQVVVVVVSENDESEDLTISDTNGKFISITIPPHSIHTFVYSND